MNYKKFEFTDENFGEQIESVFIWYNNLFILITQNEDKITIDKYKEIEDLLKEFIKNKNELNFLREEIKNLTRNKF